VQRGFELDNKFIVVQRTLRLVELDLNIKGIHRLLPGFLSEIFHFGDYRIHNSRVRIDIKKRYAQLSVYRCGFIRWSP